MLMTRIQVSNYKSYKESAEITLGPGFNVIVGQNSCGKSALLETLPKRRDDTHRGRRIHKC
jgi:chromosome segregation ATPase